MALEKFSEISRQAAMIRKCTNAGVYHGIDANVQDLQIQISDLYKHLHFVMGQIRTGNEIVALERLETLMEE